MPMKYNAPPGTASTIGPQINTSYWHRKAIIDAKKEQYFMPLSSTIDMPKNYGKTMKVLQYIPLLDDRNVNDMGIDAAGVTIVPTQFFVTLPSTPVKVANASKAAAVTTINANIGTDTVAAAGADDSGGTGFANITITGPLTSVYTTEAEADAVLALNVGAVKKAGNGNLYGSSKDVGTITSRLPTLTENGGRVNRVGFTRVERSGSIQKFGVFTEFTQESFDFDSDDELYEHLSRELVTGATQLTEAVLQKDLLNAAGSVVWSGAAVSNGTIDGNSLTTVKSVVTYDTFMRLAKILKDNRTPRQTKVITGSRMIDTRTISSGWVMYVSSDLESVLRTMVDPFNNPAFVPVHQYADATNILNGEIGTIHEFKIVVVPEMLKWSGAGATVVTNPGYMASSGRYDVYPMLVVGADAFTAIGFQTSGDVFKFKIVTKMPGEAMATLEDPYGEKGFSSIKWWYGILIKRPERIGMIKTLAKQ